MNICGGSMNTFYEELRKELESFEGDIWTETILTGDNRGNKRLLRHCPVSDHADEEVYCERICRTPKMVICGAGHVSMPIIRMGKMLGFTVTVIEDRPKFADHARTAGADQVICETFHDGLTGILGDSDTYFIIVTRGHGYDTECLEAVLKKRYAYVGMMGSRRRVAIVKNQLALNGADRQALDGVHTPIGLSIGAETPEEIAVSVMAEIIQVKSERKRGDGGNTGIYPEEILSCILGRNSGKREKMVLATIISRKGSAPRGTGTKMLILENGNTLDTIGGGCVESEIIRKGLLMMRTGTPEFQVCSVDLSSDIAEEEGMVCGGSVKVMLEML